MLELLDVVVAILALELRTALVLAGPSVVGAPQASGPVGW